MSRKILEGVNNYYTEKISRFGNTSLGVDWNSTESQYLRFEQLCDVIKPGNAFSVLDYGCGYGELYNYLSARFKDVACQYEGYDISDKMIEKAVELFGNNPGVKFYSGSPIEKVDYTIASGIFNVMPEATVKEDWLEYILTTLGTMNKLSQKGFSFNALTLYSDKEYMKDYLYYSDPLFLFDYCKKNFSRNVALLHDYDLYEFTLIVKK